MERFFAVLSGTDGIRDKLVTGVQTCALPISNVSVTELEMLVMTIKYDGISNILENITDTLVSKATSDYEERQELLDFINTNISKYKELS